MCLRRAPEKYIAGAALDRAVLVSRLRLPQPGGKVISECVCNESELSDCRNKRSGSMMVLDLISQQISIGSSRTLPWR
jgi:hypothetical protein